MSRLIVVSNRVADLSKGTQAGGLAVAVGDALREGSGVWFGWDGEIVPDGTPTGLNVSSQASVKLWTESMTRSDHQQYYLGYSNNVLWPVFHYRLDLANFSPEALEGYRRVNARFAESVSALVDPDDVIWVHDYHLIPFAAELRKRGIENRIGFFLHIPFPPPEMISAVPEHEWLVDALFAYDVVGFQTEQDVENFARYSEQTDPPEGADEQPFRRRSREMIVRAFPIGIDADAFAKMASTPEADDRIARLTRGRIKNHVIGVDRLDYSKGLPDRFRAFNRFLELYEEAEKTTVFMQIAPPTREGLAAYDEIRAELEQLSGQINGRFGDFDWTPLRYIHRSVPRETLAALFRGSNVGLVTPLRDGMNMVAKEYVAAQKEYDPGVLILSQFAGAAADLKEALIVNPYDTEEVARALQLAITMEKEERIDRHSALLERVRRRSVERWRKDFLACLNGRADSAEGTGSGANSTPGAE